VWTKADKGEGGCKNYIFLQTSFMNGPLQYILLDSLLYSAVRNLKQHSCDSELMLRDQEIAVLLLKCIGFDDMRH